MLNFRKIGNVIETFTFFSLQILKKVRFFSTFLFIFWEKVVKLGFKTYLNFTKGFRKTYFWSILTIHNKMKNFNLNIFGNWFRISESYLLKLYFFLVIRVISKEVEKATKMKFMTKNSQLQFRLTFYQDYLSISVI